MDYKALVDNVLKHEDFQKKVEAAHESFFNQKLELHMRNAFLEVLNNLVQTKHRAVAEYPRRKGHSADLGIGKIEGDKITHEYTIEFKYFFSGDFDLFTPSDPKDYTSRTFLNGVFRKDLFSKHTNADMLIIFVADWTDDINKRIEFDKQFQGMPVNDLNHFQSPVNRLKLARLKLGTRKKLSDKDIEAVHAEHNNLNWKHNLNDSITKFMALKGEQRWLLSGLQKEDDYQHIRQDLTRKLSFKENESPLFDFSANGIQVYLHNFCIIKEPI